MIRVRLPEGELRLDLAEFEDRVRRGELPPQALVHYPVVTGDGWVPARDLEIFQGLYSPDKNLFRRYFNLGRTPWCTALIVAILSLVYYLVVRHLGGITLPGLIDCGAKVDPYIVELGEWWRLLTANFLHRDRLHLVFNLLVLFNIGGALEGSYRRLDYLAIFLASALGTTITSAIFSDVTSYGASGIVLGLCGAAAVFGAKYRRLLPPRYQRYFLGLVIPYTLFILYLGLTTPGTDNWGHIGGLATGATLAAFLPARLLAPVPSRAWARRRLAVLVGVVLVVAAGGAATRAYLPLLTEYDNAAQGIHLPHPQGWTRVDNLLGRPALGNGAGAAVAFSLHTMGADQSPAARAGWFAREELDRRAELGFLDRLVRSSPEALELAGHPAHRIHFTAFDHGFPVEGDFYIIHQGTFDHVVIFAAQARRMEEYRLLFQRMVAGLRVMLPTTSPR